MEKEQNLNNTETRVLDIPVVNNCNHNKEKRYCKGCLCDVTQTMYCYCGEQVLTKDSTYTDGDLECMSL